MVEEFANVYYCGGHVCRVSRASVEKRSNLLQDDLSGRYGVGIFLPVFLVPPGD